jgi:hypothetical protein
VRGRQLRIDELFHDFERTRSDGNRESHRQAADDRQARVATQQTQAKLEIKPRHLHEMTASLLQSITVLPRISLTCPL